MLLQKVIDMSADSISLSLPAAGMPHQKMIFFCVSLLLNRCTRNIFFGCSKFEGDTIFEGQGQALSNLINTL